MAGRSAGSVIDVKVRMGPAPRVRAASSSRRSRLTHDAPTTRTTIATLKNAWANTMASSDPWIPSPRNAVATTTVGKTNGIVRAATIRPRPRNRNRLSAAVAGRAMASVTRVDSAACPSVKRTTPRRLGSANNSMIGERSTVPRALRPRPRIAPTGQRKNTPRKTSGAPTSSARPARREMFLAAIIGGRARSTA